MSEKPRVRRGLAWKRVVVLLLLGAAVNVLVAALIVYRVEMSPPELYLGEYETLAARSSFRWSRYPVPVGVRVPLFEDPDDPTWRDAPNRWYAYSSGVGITALEFEEDVYAVGSSRWYFGSRVGWPMYCLRADQDERWSPETSDYVVVSGETRFQSGIDAWTLPEWVKDRGLQPAQPIGLYGGGARSPYGPHEYFAERRIPLRPMPLGFAANTLFYAAPLFLFFLGVPVLRRCRRRRRGLCAWCAYDRAGMSAEKACPECGERD